MHTLHVRTSQGGAQRMHAWLYIIAWSLTKEALERPYGLTGVGKVAANAFDQYVLAKACTP